MANSASAMPGATTARLVSWLAAMAEKEFMMPQTVPNRPMKGAAEPVVARNGRPGWSRLISSGRAAHGALDALAPLGPALARILVAPGRVAAAATICPCARARSARQAPPRGAALEGARLPPARGGAELLEDDGPAGEGGEKSKIITPLTIGSACRNRPRNEKSWAGAGRLE